MKFEEYLQGEPLWQRGVDLVRSTGNTGIAHLQRNLVIGYNRAAHMLEMMERQSILGPMQATGRREVLSAPGAERAFVGPYLTSGEAIRAAGGES